MGDICNVAFILSEAEFQIPLIGSSVLRVFLSIFMIGDICIVAPCFKQSGIINSSYQRKKNENFLENV